MERIRSQSGMTWCDRPGPGETGVGRVNLEGIITDVTVEYNAYFDPLKHHHNARSVTADVEVDGATYTFWIDLDIISPHRSPLLTFEIDAVIAMDGDPRNRNHDPHELRRMFRSELGKAGKLLDQQVRLIDPDALTMPWPILFDWLLDRNREDLAYALRYTNTGEAPPCDT